MKHGAGHKIVKRMRRIMKEQSRVSKQLPTSEARQKQAENDIDLLYEELKKSRNAFVTKLPNSNNETNEGV